MGEETDQSSRFLRDQMQGHHAIPRHKSAVSSNQHSSPLAGDVLQAFDFNSPIAVTQKLEQRAAVRLDVTPVHAKLIELRLLPIGTALPAQLPERGNTGFAWRKPKFVCYFFCSRLSTDSVDIPGFRSVRRIVAACAEEIGRAHV